MPHVYSSQHAYLLLNEHMKNETEEFWAIALSSAKKVLSCELLFKGTVNACMIHPRDVFRFAYKNNATSLLIAHNHPSNDPLPSSSDIQITQRIFRAGKLLQVPIIDHLILTDFTYCSFADQGFKPFGSRNI